MLTWEEARRLLPSEEAEHPDSRCRGCAGMGYGGDAVTPRVAQMLNGPGMGSWRFYVEGTGSQRYVRITPHRYRARGVIHAPFIIAVAVIEGLQSDPKWTSDPSNAAIDRAYTCPWCDGTGRRRGALTIHAMKEATNT